MNSKLRSQHLLLLLTIILSVAVPGQILAQPITKSKTAQSDDTTSSTAQGGGVTFSNPVKSRWQVGVQIAGRASIKNLIVTIPIPNDWPEQTVTLDEESLPTGINKVDYRVLEQNLKQLVVKASRLPAKELVELKVTLSVTTKQINAPKDTTIFKIPGKPIPKDLKPMLGVSPRISFRNAKIRSKVKELTADKDNAWEEVKAIFDWIRENVQYTDMEATDSLTTFRKKKGGAEDLVGLFIAMCRAHKVPARTVWVDGHQHAEFCLVHNEKIHWFPVQMAGIPQFGSTSEPRIVLQKGDNMRVPETKERQKYVHEFVECQGQVRPKVNFIRKRLPAEK